jgi:hypothetical protein
VILNDSKSLYLIHSINKNVITISYKSLSGWANSLDKLWLVVGITVVTGTLYLYFKTYYYLKRLVYSKGYKSPLNRYGLAAVLMVTFIFAMTISPDEPTWSNNASYQEIFFASFPNFFITFIELLVLVSASCGVLIFNLPQLDLRSSGTRKIIFPWRLTGILLLIVGVTLPFLVHLFGRDFSNGINISLKLLPAALSCLYMGYRMRVRSLEDTQAVDSRPPVLYLRAFEHEEGPFATLNFFARRQYLPWYAAVLSGGITLEQYLKKQIDSHIGPFVALGNPLDYLQPIGAARSYYSDNDWQNEFIKLVQKSAVIIMSLDISTNLAWELQTIRQLNLSTRLYLLTPPENRNPGILSAWRLKIMKLTDDHAAQIQHSWPAFSRLLESFGYITNDVNPIAGSVLTFDSQHKITVLITNAYGPEQFVKAIWQNYTAKMNR